MCDGPPAGVAEALAMLDRALDHLTAADIASLPAGVQAEALRALGRAEAKHTAARARVLGVFAGQGGFEDDGHGSARSWLRWQTRVTHGAAAGAVAWARRLATHPVVAAALGAGELSPSWAREMCGWSDRLPEDRRGDAEEILVAAARGGAGLAALGGLAQEMYERCAPPGDQDDRFDERWFRLGITFRGAGRAEGDLTPGCAAALGAVLEALGKKAGPEDVRTGAQRRHDALEEACRRLIRAGMVPARAGQPTQVLVHLTLAQLRGLPGASAAEGAWAAVRASQPGWLSGPEAEAALCDATVVPVVTGHVDEAALDRLAEAFLLAHGPTRHSTGNHAGGDHGPGDHGSGAHAGNHAAGAHAARDHAAGDRAARDHAPGDAAGDHAHGDAAADHAHGDAAADHAHGDAAVDHAGGDRAAGDRAGPGTAGPSAPAPQTTPPRSGAAPPGAGHSASPLSPGATSPGAELDPGPPRSPAAPAGPGPGPGALSPATRERLRRALLGLAADALSGPGGLAARLRAALDSGPLTTPSLPLDIGAATETIPAHLRRAATTRHPHCAFPGCDQPASACDIHHLIPRAQGGPTTLPNLVPLCGFHHRTVIHRWGWTLTVHPDGTTTATSPDRTKTVHSHGPPGHGPPGHSPPGHDPPRHAA